MRHQILSLCLVSLALTAMGCAGTMPPPKQYVIIANNQTMTVTKTAKVDTIRVEVPPGQEAEAMQRVVQSIDKLDDRIDHQVRTPKPKDPSWGFRMTRSGQRVMRDLAGQIEVLPNGHVQGKLHPRRATYHAAKRAFGYHAQLRFLNKRTKNEEGGYSFTLNPGERAAKFALDITGPFSRAEVVRVRDGLVVNSNIKPPNFQFNIPSTHTWFSDDFDITVYWDDDTEPYQLPTITVYYGGRKSTSGIRY